MINKDTQLCMSLSGRPGNFGTRFHNYLYQKLDLNFMYKAFSTQDIEAAVKGIRALGIRGCAISMPFKESCIPFVDSLSPSARAIDSANTIVNDNGHLTAYNTDYIAVSKLIRQYQLDPQQTVVVRGSGGMAKAVIAAFKQAGFEQLTIWARNERAGRELADLYGYQYVSALADSCAAILVNVTPIGMSGGVEQSQLAFAERHIDQAQVVFDVVALPANTPLICYGKSQNKLTISGAEVIVLQAVEQFELYTQQRPSEDLIAQAAEFARTATL